MKSRGVGEGVSLLGVEEGLRNRVVAGAVMKVSPRVLVDPAKLQLCYLGDSDPSIYFDARPMALLESPERGFMQPEKPTRLASLWKIRDVRMRIRSTDCRSIKHRRMWCINLYLFFARRLDVAHKYSIYLSSTSG